MIRMIAKLALSGAVAFPLMLHAPAADAAAEVQEIVSPGGIKAWLVEEHSIPMLALEVIFTGGASRDPADQQGVAGFLAAMLDEGAGDLGSAEYSARAEELALRTGFDAGRDTFSVSARMLTENRDESVELLRTALVSPRFDEEPLERVRSQLISGIRSSATDPNSVASDAWRAAMFPDDPYGDPTSGTEESVSSIGKAELEAARTRLLDRSRMAVGVVGDITAEELGPLLDRLLGDLPKSDWNALPPAGMAQERGLSVVPLDTPQSVAMLGHEGPLRDDPDFIPAYVMNYILGGGGFASRLTEEVREKRGLTYSVYSYLAPADRAGLYIAGVSSDNARIAEAVEVIKAEWARMAEEGVTEDELEKAKRYLTGAYPLRFDSNGKIARILAGLMIEGFSPDYIRERNDLIEAVTVEDVARVAKKWLKPERLRIVVVGRPEGLTGDLPIPGFETPEVN